MSVIFFRGIVSLLQIVEVSTVEQAQSRAAWCSASVRENRHHTTLSGTPAGDFTRPTAFNDLVYRTPTRRPKLTDLVAVGNRVTVKYRPSDGNMNVVEVRVTRK
jgi:hypothetical protein